MIEHVAAGYMTRFQCLGTTCEDTCCKAWEVPITERDQARLVSALGAPAAAQLVTRIPDGRGGQLTVLRKLPDRACPELDPAQLCSIHARFGEAALPDTCAAYPREIGRLDERLELTGHLSCPEIARLCLLTGEGELVPAAAAAFGRATVRLTIVRDGAAVPPYFAAFETVRDALVELCGDASLPLASRLYLVAELATRLAPFYHRAATVAEPERLAAVLAEVRRPDVRAELEAKRVAGSVMNGLALQLVLGMVFGRAEAAPAFATVVTKVAGTFAAAAGRPVDAGTPAVALLTAIGPGELWRTHLARRPKPGTPLATRLDLYLARYSRNYWLQDWYPASETLFEHLMHLVLRVALVRFLLVAHPDFHVDADEATCDRAAVEVVYATSRAYDHNQDVRAGLSATLQRRGMLTVDHCAAMLKL